MDLMVGAIGFEPIALKQTEVLAGLGWQLKDRNGSQRNNYWTRIGHCRLAKAANSIERFFAHIPDPTTFRPMTQFGRAQQNPQRLRNKKTEPEESS
jgi:hypothetical protein